MDHSKGFKTLLGEVNLDSISLHFNADSQYIYHYTSQTALLNILKSKRLRFVNRHYQNDQSEGRYVLELCLKRIREFWIEEEIFANLKQDFIEECKRTHEEILYDNFQIYQVSFSFGSDSLCMWNYYGIDDGCNLKFDRKDLEKYFREQSAFCPEADIVIHTGKVIYDEARQVKIIRDVIKKYLTEYKKKYYEIKSKEENRQIAQSIIRKLLTFGVFFKHEKFKDEEEYRIAFDNQLGFADKIISYLSPPCFGNEEKYCLDFYSRKGLIVPYVDVYFNRMALKGIGLSPFLQAEYAKAGVWLALNANGFKHITKRKITLSEIPVRF